MMVKENIQNISSYNKSGPFLATTSLEEFWDTSMPVVFLGERCRRYSRRDRWEKLNAVVLQSPFHSAEKLYDAYIYSNYVYEIALKELVCVFNKIHSKNYSERYWRIVLGPWLFHYIDACYERYTALKMALSKYPYLVTIGLSEECFLTPRDTRSHYNLLGEDLYNLQIYTRIFDEIGKDTQIEKDSSPNYENIASRDLLSKFTFYQKRILHNCLHLFYKWGYRKNLNIVAHNSYFSPYVDLILFLKTCGKFRPFIKKMVDLESVVIDKSLRSQIKMRELGNNEFGTILGHMLPHDIPQCFLETYDSIGREVQKNYPPRPNFIFSTISYYFDEYFKQWAAEKSERGTVLIGVQHGGNYGSDSFVRVMDHELSITDRFYSWGWKSNESYLRISPMPATKLVGRKTIGASNHKEGVLFVGTSEPRYLNRIQISNNAGYPDYLSWQFRFFKSLFIDIQKKVRTRLFYDYGWDLYERWKDLFPDIVIENLQKHFSKSLDDCRIFVCDHLSTVFVEALSADKPTILFWDSRIVKLRPEAKPYYDGLRAAGILHDTPESAANTVCHVYDDVEGWWKSPERRGVLKKFCNRFARTSANAINDWGEELMGLKKK